MTYPCPRLSRPDPIGVRIILGHSRPDRIDLQNHKLLELQLDVA
jgi:hypothetical protein